MSLTTTRAGRAGRWRIVGICAAATIAFSALQFVWVADSEAQVKAPTKKQVRSGKKSGANAPQANDNEADRLNEKWLSEHNQQQQRDPADQTTAATPETSPAPQQKAEARTTTEADDERVSSVPGTAPLIGAASRSIVANSVTLVKAGSPASALNAAPGGANLPIYKELGRAFSGFAPNSGKVELVKGTTGDGFSRLLYANLDDGKSRQTYWWFAPPDQPEGWFDEQGRRLGGTAMAEPRPGSRISSPFGVRRYYGRRTGGGFHNGIDFEGKTGQPIFAAADGVINHQGWYFNYGRTVKISHADNLETLYAHMSRFVDGLQAGSRVRKGDLIGYIGSTGRSTGPHLHFSTIVNGQFVDPAPYLSTNGGSQLSSGALVVFRQWQQEVRAAVDTKAKSGSRQGYQNLQGGEDWSTSPFGGRNPNRL